MRRSGTTSQLSSSSNAISSAISSRQTGNGKMGVSMILCEAMTSAEGEASMTWDAAKSKFARFKPFDDPLYRDLLELVFTHIRECFIEIDRDFIYEIGVLYLSIAAQAMIASLKNRFQEE